ncbi:hypothetical protein NW759_001950 [Fusarium solani]|nr:hypothetical protein NW759_001950 [Fusarium solani]
MSPAFVRVCLDPTKCLPCYDTAPHPTSGGITAALQRSSIPSTPAIPHAYQNNNPSLYEIQSIPPKMNKDSCFTFIHMQRPRDADLFEDFCKDKLPDDEIYVPPAHQPINPEDEDDVVPDQHAAFGIQRATQKSKEPAWKDLGLAQLMNKGPGAGSSAKPKGSRSLPR